MVAEPSGHATGEPAAGGTVARHEDERPAGVTILAVLSFLGAAALAMFAIFAFVAGGMVADLVGSEGPAGFFVGAGAAFVGMGSLFLAAINGLIGWGLWTGRGWAWVLTLVFEGLWALGSLMGLLDGDPGALLPLAIAGGIVWYLFRPWVRRFFGNPA